MSITPPPSTPKPYDIHFQKTCSIMCNHCNPSFDIRQQLNFNPVLPASTLPQGRLANLSHESPLDLNTPGKPATLTMRREFASGRQVCYAYWYCATSWRWRHIFGQFVAGSLDIGFVSYSKQSMLGILSTSNIRTR